MTRADLARLDTGDVVGIRHAAAPFGANGGARVRLIEVWRRAEVLSVYGGTLLVRYTDGERRWISESQLAEVRREADVEAWEDNAQ